jgi:CDP-diacylglycerol--serine O-phosphatidyltransferase
MPPAKGEAQDKQARLLSQEAGHFSLVRALHLADFITELNGTFSDTVHIQ